MDWEKLIKCEVQFVRSCEIRIGERKPTPGELFSATTNPFPSAKVTAGSGIFIRCHSWPKTGSKTMSSEQSGRINFAKRFMKPREWVGVLSVPFQNKKCYRDFPES